MDATRSPDPELRGLGSCSNRAMSVPLPVSAPLWPFGPLTPQTPAAATEPFRSTASPAETAGGSVLSPHQTAPTPTPPLPVLWPALLPSHSHRNSRRSKPKSTDYGLGFDVSALSAIDQAVIAIAWTAQQNRDSGVIADARLCDCHHLHPAIVACGVICAPSPS